MKLIEIWHVDYMITLWVERDDKANVNARLNVLVGTTPLCTPRKRGSVCSKINRLLVESLQGFD